MNRSPMCWTALAISWRWSTLVALPSYGIRNYVAKKEEDKKYRKYTAVVQKTLDALIESLASATLFLMLAGGPKADTIRKDLANEFVKGHDNYPTDMTSVRKCIASYKTTDVVPVVALKPAPIESLTFAQSQTAYEGKQPPDVRKVTCHNPKC